MGGYGEVWYNVLCSMRLERNRGNTHSHTQIHTHTCTDKKKEGGERKLKRNCETLNLQISNSHRMLGNMETWLFVGPIPRFLAIA